MIKKTFSYDEALKTSIDYFSGDEFAAKVFLDKYAMRNCENALVENSPDMLHRRLAKELARIEKLYPDPMQEDFIYQLLKEFRAIVLQGSPMSAIGNNYSVQSISNCFVIESPLDSYGGILKSDQELVQIAKRRGGIGFDISKIRPKGVPTHNAAKTSDGIGIFMQRFSNSCREVAQGGRRGALLLSMSIHHPEIETFINIKKDKTKVTGANVSVRISDEFMHAVASDGEYEQRWPVDAESPTITRRVRARKIWEQIITGAWESAEPGVLFWDTIKKNTPSDAYASEGFASTSTNPCGEIVLNPGGACLLSAINLMYFVENKYTKDARFNYDKYREYVGFAMRLLDDMVDLELEKIKAIIAKIENDPEPQAVKHPELNLWKTIEDAYIRGRRTGLGITALGDALAALGITYGSEASVLETEKIYKTLALGAHEESIALAASRGSFPVWDLAKEKEHPYLTRIIQELPLKTQTQYQKTGRRNISLTTTAPTGTVSVLTQTTSGIEPVFMLQYKRRKKLAQSDTSKADFVDALGDKWHEFTIYHKGLQDWMDIAQNKNIEDSPYFRATSADIDWLNSVKIQSVAQRWIDHSISKTCNLPSSATKDLVSQIYMEAWKSGCKGFTIYRDGCRDGVLVSLEPLPPTGTCGAGSCGNLAKTTAPKRPKILPCTVHHNIIKGIRYYAVVGLLHDEPYEVFTGINHGNDGEIHIPKKLEAGVIIKEGKGKYILKESKDSKDVYDLTNGHSDPTADALTRMISCSLRHGAEIQFVVDQLEKTKGDLISFAKVLARNLKKYIPDGSEVTGELCPSCKSKLIRMEGCKKCVSCEYSACG